MAGVLATYEERVRLGEIEVDPAQAEAAARLDRLAREVEGWAGRKGSLIDRAFGRVRESPRGVYLHGSVGRGKTMLMDLFFEGVEIKLKRRQHFHEFMADAHDLIGAARKTSIADPVRQAAVRIAREARLFCFDELHVTDIADAMIIGRLFSWLMQKGVVLVATSNAAPQNLYKHGLNRQLFLPFIDIITRHTDVVELKSAKDFRLDKLSGRQLYFSPLGRASRAELDGHWERLTGHHPGQPSTLDVKGRTLKVPLASMGVARFAFADLCEKPLGAIDYLQIAHAFHTILIDDIPVLGPARRDVARRFINLIDTLYDNRVCLIAAAEAEPDLLYAKGDGADLFVRTASRLTEMRSEAYLEGRSARLPSAEAGAQRQA